MTPLYLYQTVHLFGGKARNVAAHIAVLDAASRSLFGRRYAPDAKRLEERLVATAAGAGAPRGVSSFVRIEWSAEGEEQLVAAGISLYAGYALRSLMPTATALRFDYPLTDAPTSAREAVAQLAARIARQSGGDIALRIDSEGNCSSAEDAPLFGVRDRTIITAPGAMGVEHTLAMRAIRAAGLEWCEAPIPWQTLAQFDELFYADFRGITAIARCGNQPFMSLLSERVAGAMEELFRKK